MFLPNEPCIPRQDSLLGGLSGCCTPGFACSQEDTSLTGFSCKLDPLTLSYSFDATQLAAELPSSATPSGDGSACGLEVPPYGQCGGMLGVSCMERGDCRPAPWPTACCPNGFSCKVTGPEQWADWTCQVDVSDAPPVDAGDQLLQYPPLLLPADACACRTDWDGGLHKIDCPSVWDPSISAGATPAPPLQFNKRGELVEVGTSKVAQFKGINWFGWENNQQSVDGLWAYCDDNQGWCPVKDGEIADWQTRPGEWWPQSMGPDNTNAWKTTFWKRTLTNDLSTAVHRMKLLGINAVRVPFTFATLNGLLTADSGTKDYNMFMCQVDNGTYIALNKTLDPALNLGSLPPSVVPPYSGVLHPPPRAAWANSASAAKCDKPWSLPFDPRYDASGTGQGDNLTLSLCNWYVPFGANVPSIHKFLSQIQVLAAAGMYVLLDYHPISGTDPNMVDPTLFAANWRNLWKILMDLPDWSKMSGRIFPDLVNEASRYGCQWERACVSRGTTVCAPATQLVHAAVTALRGVDPKVTVFANGLGQTGSSDFPECQAYYNGMNWGDGFITDAATIASTQISDASTLFASDLLFPKDLNKVPTLGLSPHVYPSSISGWGEEYNTPPALKRRMELSWGNKSRAQGSTSDGSYIRRTHVVIGEFGARDNGDNYATNTDTTRYNPADMDYFTTLSTYIKPSLPWRPAPIGWLFWAWNANSGDTKGLVGPQTTWRQVQWTKVRVLYKFGLRPWYCALQPGACNA